VAVTPDLSAGATQQLTQYLDNEVTSG
jgi:hypothetical protein